MECVARLPIGDRGIALGACVRDGSRSPAACSRTWIYSALPSTSSSSSSNTSVCSSSGSQRRPVAAGPQRLLPLDRTAAAEALDKEIDEGDGEVEQKRVYGKRAKAAAKAYADRGALVMLHMMQHIVMEMYGQLPALIKEASGEGDSAATLSDLTLSPGSSSSTCSGNSARLVARPSSTVIPHGGCSGRRVSDCCVQVGDGARVQARSPGDGYGVAARIHGAHLETARHV